MLAASNRSNERSRRWVAMVILAMGGMVGCSTSSGPYLDDPSTDGKEADGASSGGSEDTGGVDDSTTTPSGGSDTSGASDSAESSEDGSTSTTRAGSDSGGQESADSGDTSGQDIDSMSRVRRITRVDLDRVLSDLLYLDVSVADTYPDELPTLHGYFNDGALAVNARFNTALAQAAESLAARVRSEATAYDLLVGCTTADTTCRDAFLHRFITRAYRRPPSDAEQEAYQQLFDAGAELVGSEDPFADGVQLVIEAALQSPNFIYRIERGTEDAEGNQILTPHEMATRLSFLLWGSIPDDELFAAAESGALATADAIAQTANRMVNAPRTTDRIIDFHHRWMQMDGLYAASHDPEMYPEFSAELVDDLQEEFALFVEEVTVHERGGVAELLTAPFTFINDNVDRVYGSEAGIGEAFVRIEFDSSSSRGGLLTQPGFLAGHSSSNTTTSPILRGVFVLERLMCFDVPMPPPGAEATEPPEPEMQPVTTRDFFTWKTSMAECQSCHSLINPIGWAFEGFDAIGRDRTTENGAPIDTSGTASFPGVFDFDGARSLTLQLLTYEDLYTCYAKHWLEYAYGRPARDEDAETLSDLASDFSEASFGARDAMVSLASSPRFRTFVE